MLGSRLFARCSKLKYYDYVDIDIRKQTRETTMKWKRDVFFRYCFRARQNTFWKARNICWNEDFYASF